MSEVFYNGWIIVGLVWQSRASYYSMIYRRGYDAFVWFLGWKSRRWK